MILSQEVYNKTIPALFFLVTCFLAFGLRAEGIDSLQTALAEATDTNRVIILNELAWQLKTNRPLKAKDFALKALEEAEKLNYLKGQAYSLNYLGIIQKNKGQLDSAMYYYQESLEIRHKLNDSSLIGGAYLNIGNLLRKKGEFDKALDYLNNAASYISEIKDLHRWSLIQNSVGTIYLKNGDFKAAQQSYRNALEGFTSLNSSLGKSESLLNMGTLYETQEEWESALKEYKWALSYAREGENYQQIGKCYNNIGNVHYSTSNLDEAFQNYEKSIPYYLESRDSIALAGVFENLGNIYLEYKDMPMAKATYLKAMSFYTLKNISEGLANVNYLLGRFYETLDEPDSAFVHYKNGLLLAQKGGYIITELEAYGALSGLYAKEGLFDSAYHFQSSYRQLRDTVLQSFKASKRFEIESKEQKLEIVELEKSMIEQQAKSERESSFNRLLMVIIIFMVILFFVLFKYYQRHKEGIIYSQKMDDLIKEQELKYLYANLEGEETERRKIAREIHDDIGSHLSMAKLNLQDVEGEITKITSKVSKSEQEKVSIKFKLVDNLFNQAVERIRAISKNMLSGVLMNFGLRAALEDLVSTLQGTNNITIEFIEHGLDDRLDFKQEVEFYRIYQELLANAIKHSKANHVTLQLILKDNELNLIVEDDGIGFDPDKLSRDSGIGLKNIEARILELKGDWEIESMPGQGCMVKAWLKVAKSNSMNQTLID